jgi:hypothetical protein
MNIEIINIIIYILAGLLVGAALGFHITAKKLARIVTEKQKKAYSEGKKDGIEQLIDHLNNEIEGIEVVKIDDKPKKKPIKKVTKKKSTNNK